MGFWVLGFGFEIWGSGFGVSSFGFGVWILSFGLVVLSFGLGVLSRAWVLSLGCTADEALGAVELGLQLGRLGHQPLLQPHRLVVPAGFRVERFAMRVWRLAEALSDWCLGCRV